MTTQYDLTNRALAIAGTRSQITNFTDTPEGKYAGLLYAEFRDFLLRTGDYDFALQSGAAVSAGSVGAPWIYSYNYPNGAIRIRQLVPTVYNPLDPQPVAWNLNTSGGTNILIYTKVAISSIIWTHVVIEDLWPADFTDSFVRLLASGLFFALENRIEAHKEAISEALSFAQMANARDP